LFKKADAKTDIFIERQIERKKEEKKRDI